MRGAPAVWHHRATAKVVVPRVATRRTRASLAEAIALRRATAADADAIFELIVGHLSEGHLLPRERGEIVAHAHRFTVAVQGSAAQGAVVACAELAPLGSGVAEVRSLVVGRAARDRGVGHRLIEELGRRAGAEGFTSLCAFTHSPAYFVHRGFSIVPHTAVPEKIATDCRTCARFRQCGQYAVVRTITKASPATAVPECAGRANHG